MSLGLSTKKQLDDMLQERGYVYSIPCETGAFSSGDGDLMEKAPLGYYRFHFWNADGTPKEHLTYVGNDRPLGCLCISLAKESHDQRAYYRVLIRTERNTKSCIVTRETIAALHAKETNKNILGIALSNYLYDEKQKKMLFGEDNEAAEIQSLFSVDACSVRSEMSDRTGFLPHSRFRELSQRPELDVAELHPALLNTQLTLADEDVVDGHKGNALQRQGSDTAGTSSNKALPEDEEISVKKLVRGLIKVSDKKLPYALLELEERFLPDSYSFDVFCAENEQPQHWNLFCSFLGKRQERTNDAILAKPLTSTLPTTPTQSQKCSHSQKKQRAIEEFLDTEKNYLNKLLKIREGYIQKLNRLFEDREMNKVVLRQIFSGIPEILADTAAFVELLDTIQTDTDRTPRLDEIAKTLVSQIKTESYSKYINGIAASRAALKKIQAEAFFEKLCREQEQKDNGLALADLLIEPVQRITRYQLLLTEMLKTADDKEHKAVAAAQEHVRRIIAYIEKKEQEFSSITELFNIVQSIAHLPVDLLDGRRRLLYQNKVYLLSALGDKKKALLILLSDYLLLADTEKKPSLICLTELLAVQAAVNTAAGSQQPSRINLAIEPECTRYGPGYAAAFSGTSHFALQSCSAPFTEFMQCFANAQNNLDQNTEKRIRGHNGTLLRFCLNPPKDSATGIPILLCNRLSPELLQKHATDALAIVQASEHTLRCTIKTQTELYCTGNYCAVPECFLDPANKQDRAQLDVFFTALHNYRKLHALYPPFPRILKNRIRQLLVDIVQPTVQKNKTVFKSIKNKLSTRLPAELSLERNTLWKNMDETDFLKEDLVLKTTKNFLFGSQEYLLIEMTCHVALYLENAVSDLAEIYVAREKGCCGPELFRKTLQGCREETLRTLGSQTPDGLAAFVLMSLQFVCSNVYPAKTVQKIIEARNPAEIAEHRDLVVFLFGHFRRMALQNNIDTAKLSECIFLNLFENESAKKTSERQRLIKGNKQLLVEAIEDQISAAAVRQAK